MEDPKEYFIYRHISMEPGTCKPIVIYVGYGLHTKNSTTDRYLYKRAYEKGKGHRTQEWNEVVAQLGREVEIVMDNLTFNEAKKKEIELIALYGRADLGKGTLLNKTDGGQGSRNFKHTDEFKERSSRERTVSVETKLKNSIVYESNGCWTWKGTITNGIPIIFVKKRSHNAARFLYKEVNNITLTSNQHVHRNCDNSLCVNPEHQGVHLAKGVRDKSVLKEDDVRTIKKLAYDGVQHNVIAEMYNVPRTQITKIAIGYRWSWVVVEGIPNKLTSDYREKNKKSILCEQTGEVFGCAKDASIKLFGTKDYLRDIRGVCRRATTGLFKGYNFKFATGG
jgi:hypothetical protein